MQLNSVEVSGGSFQTIVDLTTEPAALGLFTESLEPTVVALDPVNDGSQPVSILFTSFNSTGELIEGFDFALADNNGSFTSVPTLTFGTALDASVSGPNDEFAELITPVPAFGTAFYGLEFNLSSPTTLTITPLIPEPATAAVIGLPLGLALRLRRR